MCYGHLRVDSICRNQNTDRDVILLALLIYFCLYLLVCLYLSAEILCDFADALGCILRKSGAMSDDSERDSNSIDAKD